jgi:circadian clock protein KaiC
MTPIRSRKKPAPTPTQLKAPTGIPGFDEMTGGGMPHGRAALLVGGPGSGKTIFALQFLVHGAEACREPGIFVAFEETPQRIVANFQTFGWDLEKLQPKKLLFIDAQPSPDLIQSGAFDLGGMLAVLGERVRAMKARRIVFDALDIVLALMPDGASKRREIYRLHEWLLAHGVTAIITSKDDGDDTGATSTQPFGFMQFMVDCSVVLNHRVVLGVSQRNLRVQKYRGSAFDENESPFVIGKGGFDVAISRMLGRVDAKVTNERVTTGVERLDTMLGGGYYRAASVLITGFPGTAENHAQRRIRRSGLRARRTHCVCRLRFGRHRGDPQPRVGGNPPGASRKKRGPPHGLGSHDHRQRGNAAGADQGDRE